jgi:ligand-binding SRPBCC domain-containing protein
VKTGSFFVVASSLLLTSLFFTPGCKRTLSQKELDQGRASLETGLQAWQKGERPDALQKLTPPLHFRDEDWMKGMRLTAWEITSTNGSVSDLTPRYEVVLSLLDRNGKKIQRQVVYQIERKETIAIVRHPYF